jgi:ABC-2 family transporter protein
MTFTVARQMVSAEVLKLRRNRGLMAFAFLLSVVVIVLVFVVGAIQHSSNPSQNAPAGGTEGFSHTLKLLGVFFGVLTAAVIGAEAGTADRSSGVFRDLVATGRSRLALYAVRVPAAVLVTWVFTGLAYALGVIGTFAFADGLATPSASTVIQGLLWIWMANVVVVAFAVGVGSLTGSRAVTLTGVIGWQTVATQLLVNIPSLGSARHGLLTPALAQIAPIRLDLAGVTMAAATGWIVTVCWLAVPTAVGAWRTRTVDA